MGTWGAGPFKNDAALDFVSGIIDTLMESVNDFMSSPQIDENFDPAFAAIAMLNAIMAITPSRPWDSSADKAVDGGPIRDAMLACYDEQIDSMEPKADFKRDQRAALVTTLDEFVAKLAR
jgi:hypothetical protein